MFNTHTTEDGQTMLIGQMSDDHLKNTIKRLCRELKQCSMILSNQAVIDKTGLLQAINENYNTEEMKERAEMSAKGIHESLKNYVLEASLRKLDISENLQETYQRTQRMGNNAELILKGINHKD